MFQYCCSKYQTGWMLPAVCLWIYILSLAVSAQDFPKNVILAKVDYQGLNLFTPDEMTPMADLKIGRPVTLPDIENAAEQLSYLGYFKSVRFEYRYHGTQRTLTFQVEEDSRFVDCFFDNFVGFNDGELLEAIQKKLPSFKGKVPLKGNILPNP
jgi:outer membrane protein assembly factor BamA